MTKRAFTTLKLERNVARAPIWGSRAGISLQRALDWPDLPVHGDAFHIAELSGALGPLDLLVFTRVCTLYAAARPSDRRVEVSLGDIARWTGNAAIGGSQHRTAIACLNRLRGATFTSSVRFGGKGTEKLLHGWGLIDEWLMPEGGRHIGSVRVSNAIADLVDAKSVVLLDAVTLGTLVRRSGLAARLWVYLEADTLGEKHPGREGHRRTGSAVPGVFGATGRASRRTTPPRPLRPVPLERSAPPTHGRAAARRMRDHREDRFAVPALDPSVSARAREHVDPVGTPLAEQSAPRSLRPLGRGNLGDVRWQPGGRNPGRPRDGSGHARGRSGVRLGH